MKTKELEIPKGVKARCKFRVTKVVREANQDHVFMDTQYSEHEDEDTKFAEATPSGCLNVLLTNPKLISQFSPGQVYYLDLTPVPVGV